MVALAAEAAEVERATVGTGDAAAGISTLGTECLAGAHLRATESTLGGAGRATHGAYHHSRHYSGATRWTRIGSALGRATFLAEACARFQTRAAIVAVAAVIGL